MDAFPSFDGAVEEGHELDGSMADDLWGNVWTVRAQRATFQLTIPISAPNLPSHHGEAPQVDHVALHTFPTKMHKKETAVNSSRNCAPDC